MAIHHEFSFLEEAIHKIQLSLLESVRDETKLFVAASLISRADYDDVVTERSIANVCGYPLCQNALPSERPRKGRYRISLKEHKVYDLHETYLYCSPSCVVNSKAFAGTLEEERISTLSQPKIDEILRRFEESSLESGEECLSIGGDLGFSRLKIQEISENNEGDVSFEEWIGPSNAIEGYVPHRDHSSKPLNSTKSKSGQKNHHTTARIENNPLFSDMGFTSCIIIGDGYSISKEPSDLEESASVSKANSKDQKGKMRAGNMNKQLPMPETTHLPQETQEYLKESRHGKNQILSKEEKNLSEAPSSSDSCGDDKKAKLESYGESVAHMHSSMLKSSLKSAGARKATQSVTWADERPDCEGKGNLCEIREMEDKKQGGESKDTADGDDVDMLRFASAEACAIALQQAADAVASGEADVTDAVSEAGIIVLPSHTENGAGTIDDIDIVEPESALIKWPMKPAILNPDTFNPEDLYDATPEGFNLNLSPFATMWMAIFSWITSSSLAYIYGRDESFHEEYLTVNGMEYPQKIVLSDGRSAEIKQTLAVYLSRALPDLVGELRIRTPVSDLGKELERLLGTMSFLDALPSLGMKQWQVITLLFLEAISVCRIPAFAHDMTIRRMLLQKLLDGSQLGLEEYEVMKDHIIPLGRAPEFSTQSGG